MRAEGLGTGKIARQLGVARSSVYRMLEAPGLEVA
jgi:DNA-binding IclR family transcriptional regulator